MKNPFKLLYHWILKKIRKRTFNKRQEVYDDVIETLGAALEQKVKDQKTLTEKIRAELLIFYKIGGRSKFIPEELPGKELAVSHIYNKFGKEMADFSVKLTGNLTIICT